MTSPALRIPPGPPEPYRATEDLFAWMNDNFARYGDIYKATIYGGPVYVVSAPEYCERILRRNWQNYLRKGVVVKRIALLLGNSLIASNGDFWASQRRMIQPAFTKGAVTGLGDLIARVNLELLAQWKEAARSRQTVNVTRDVSLMVLKFTLSFLFGEDYEITAPHCRIFTEESARNLEFAHFLRPLGQFIIQIVERRRREGVQAGDALARLMEGRDRDSGAPMSDDQIAREAMTIIVAGHETTASLLNWMWLLLARNPEVQQRLGAELDAAPWGASPPIEHLPRYAYARQIIDEALRVYPPLWLMTRKAVQDDQLGEFFVPAGTEIYLSPYLIQRNPQYWELPERFDPDRMRVEKGQRPELAMCPFGAGPRNCIGEYLALVESQMHLMLFARELRMHDDTAQEPGITVGLNLLSKRDIVLRPELRAGTAAAS